MRPPAKFNTLARYQEIKDANFTYAFPIYGPCTPDDVKHQLDFCQQVGLKAFVYDPRMSAALSDSVKKGIDGMIADYAKHPALAGYFIADEPPTGAYPDLANVVAYLHEKDPAHPGYINLLPTYAGLDVVNAKSYDDYVRRFVQVVKPFAISYDHYHFTTGGDGPEFFLNLGAVRKVSLDTSTPFWNIVLTTQHGGYRNLTEPELRFEAMQTLAYGGKGLVWFTYWSPTGFDASTVWAHSIINADGSKDPHYDMIKHVNASTLSLGNQLLHATSTATYQLGTLPPHGTPAPKDAPLTTNDKADLTVGLFTDHLALLANRDYKAPAHFTLNKPTESFDPATKTWHPTPAPLDIPPGDAILLRYQP